MKRYVKSLAALLLCLLLLPIAPAKAAKEPIRIAFIDSGISTKHIAPEKVAEGKNYVFPEADTRDRIGHGTATAGMVLGAADQGVTGVFSEAVAVPLVVVDAYPSGAVENGGPAALCAAIRDAVDVFGCRIINVSLSTTEDSEELRAAVAYAELSGALIVTCAGNDGEGAAAYYPAAYPTTISVGAADGEGRPASFSQNGADVLAAGVGLPAATNKNGAAPATVSGTSYSCAVISGVCAKLCAAYPELRPEEMRQWLYGLAADVLAPGYDERSGWGLVPADAEIPAPYLDVPEGAWSRPAILRVSERGLMNGTGGGRFDPKAAMTRAMFAAVLYRMAGSPRTTGRAPFSDAAEGMWYTDAVSWAAEQGFIVGYGDGRFGPEDTVTREQMVTILWRCFGKPAGQRGLGGFKDADSVSGWAGDAFCWAVDAGVVSGRPDGALDPKAAASREETAQLLVNLEQIPKA